MLGKTVKMRGENLETPVYNNTGKGLEDSTEPWVFECKRVTPQLPQFTKGEKFSGIDNHKILENFEGLYEISSQPLPPKRKKND